MNIFKLHFNPVKAAMMMCNSHVNKMILESCQLLSTVKRYYEGERQTVYIPSVKYIIDGNRCIPIVKLRKRIIGVLPTDTVEKRFGITLLTDWKAYLPTHEHHPSCKWVKESSQNYRWLFQHYIGLLREFRYRSYTDKRHKCMDMMVLLALPPEGIPNIPETPFKLAMPDEYKTQCPVESYRAYYKHDKQHTIKFKYSRRPKPAWLD